MGVHIRTRRQRAEPIVRENPSDGLETFWEKQKADDCDSIVPEIFQFFRKAQKISYYRTLLIMQAHGGKVCLDEKHHQEWFTCYGLQWRQVRKQLLDLEELGILTRTDCNWLYSISNAEFVHEIRAIAFQAQKKWKRKINLRNILGRSKNVSNPKRYSYRTIRIPGHIKADLKELRVYCAAAAINTYCVHFHAPKGECASQHDGVRSIKTRKASKLAQVEKYPQSQHVCEAAYSRLALDLNCSQPTAARYVAQAEKRGLINVYRNKKVLAEYDNPEMAHAHAEYVRSSEHCKEDGMYGRLKTVRVAKGKESGKFEVFHDELNTYWTMMRSKRKIYRKGLKLRAAERRLQKLKSRA